MKMHTSSLFVLAFALGFLAACNSTDGKNEKNGESDSSLLKVGSETPKNAISLSPINESPEFPDATLTVSDVKTVLQGKDSVKVTFNYGVKNYELKNQTSSPNSTECNNSKDGQHIHFIIDNKPYAALYEPTHSVVLPLNSEHYVMSFLSRSFHESLKNKEAGVLVRFSIDAKGNYKKLDLPSTPMVFYSRPKGDYVGKDTKNVLLDFYVYNTILSPTGNKVKATINGNEFMIDNWKPQFIQHAPMGAMKVKLELLGTDGKVLAGENTVVERDVQLAQQEPVR